MFSLAIAHYEKYIMGQTTIELPGTTKKEKFEGTKEIIRYVFTYLLEWTPEDAIYHVSKELLDKMHLTEFIKNYYIFPDDLVRDMDYDYIVAIAFGIPVDYKFQLLKHKRLIKSGIETKYKKQLFNGKYGRLRAAYLLMDMISTSVALPMDEKGTNIEKLYARFANSADINKILKKEGLYNACTELYNSPLEFLHYSLAPETQDHILFAVHEFDNLFRTTAKRAKAEHSKKIKKTPENVQ